MAADADSRSHWDPREGTRERNFSLMNEPSVVLRHMALMASLWEDGTFRYDEQREEVKKSGQFVSEGGTEKNIHIRLLTQTMGILAKISLRVDDLREKTDAKSKALVKEYDELDANMSSCSIALVGATFHPRKGGSDSNSVTVSTMVAKKKLEAEIMVSEASTADAFFEASENGYRQLNCPAAWHWYRALKLAYHVGYIDAEEATEVNDGAPTSNDVERRIDEMGKIYGKGERAERGGQRR